MAYKAHSRAHLMLPMVPAVVVVAFLSSCSSPLPTTRAGAPLTKLNSIEPQVGAVWGLAFTPDGHDLAVAVHNFDKRLGSMRIYRVDDATLARNMNLDYATGVRFSPDGKTMAVNTNKSILLWRVSDWTLLNTIAPSPVSTSTIPTVGFAFSPDGATIATRSSTYPIGGQVDTWQLADGSHIKTVVSQTGEGDNVLFTPDGQTIVTETDKQAQLWSAADGTPVRTLDEAVGVTGIDLAVSPDGQTLATGSTVLWKISDGTRLRELPTEVSIASLAFSPDGTLLATGAWSADDRVKVWRVADGQLLYAMDAGGGTVTAVTFSPDGKTLATGTTDGIVNLWQIK